MRLTSADIEPMSLGASVLGGGGAGDPYLGELMLGELLADGSSVEILAINELADDDEVAPIALIGSPHAGAEKLLGRDQIATIYSAQPLRTKPPIAVLPCEMAGLNALYPLAAAALLGVPCVDGDLTGHGVATLDLTTLELDDAQPDAYILCDSRLRTVTIQKSGDLSFERLVRPAVETMGWLATLSMTSLSGAFCRAHVLAGTLSRCLELGRLFRELAGLAEGAAVERFTESAGVLVGSGTVVERIAASDAAGARATLVIATEEGPSVGTAADGLAEGTADPLRVELRNEFLIAARAGRLLATAPDVIVVVDRATWQPLSTEDVGPGHDVHVLALAAHPRWRSADGRRLAGPRAHGYRVDYVDVMAGARPLSETGRPDA